MWSLPELFDAARRLWLPCVAGGLLAQAVSPASKTEAAEIHLHSEFRTDGGLVFLRDVADVYAADPAQVKILGDIDLIAAPPDGQKRFLPLREIQDLLVLRGVNLREQRFTGASQVKIVGVIEGHTAPERHLPAVPVKQTNDTVRQAILRYLNDREPDIDSWSVKFSLDDDQARLIAANTKGLAIEGGRKPWTGAQSFTVALAVGSKTVRLPINAEVTLPPMIVVATQSLGKGAIVRPADVRLQPGQANPGSARTFSAVEDVIGKEVTKQIAEGQILDDSVVRPQVLVHRGEIVTVYARTAGIQVRVSARARDDGAQGELITVESLTKRENYFARVTAPQTCDVFAHAMTAAEDVDARPANADRLTAFRRASAKNRAVPVNAQSPANAHRRINRNDLSQLSSRPERPAQVDRGAGTHGVRHVGRQGAEFQLVSSGFGPLAHPLILADTSPIFEGVEQPRVFKLNDLLTVIVLESSQVNSENTVQRRKQGQLNAELNDFIKLSG